MISSYLDMQERRGPLGFLISLVAFSALGLGLYELSEKALHFNHHFSGLAIFLGILAGILCYSIILTQAIRRTNDMGRAGILSMLSAIPVLNVPLFLIFPSSTVFGSALIVMPILGVLSTLFLMLPGKKA
ncbi:hypothetical protein [Rubellicoccus peritrichatus]|uniref:Uncharacterized protein n=1 Tax=Rubellicoccus peritrichatus TaxID=3080537 RepID=A0AAQ3QUQ9_9BACT|nr:hypothetical protein [Puniceicoccus sp. CR14]WOO40185.1 hypothetical protein RZN69_16310 [Puniceicoccus sp. CR14]